MKITIFSSNQPRHLNLVRAIAKISEQVFFVSEVNTVFPGQVNDFFFKSDIMQSYFLNVIASEQKIFGNIGFLPQNVSTMSVKLGDLNRLSQKQLEKSLLSDVFIVFGASYIKGWLVDFLIRKRAINIHMGLSPYYRGSSCNFWAMYDNSPEYVGATIHMLSKGLDSGDILFHCLPLFKKSDTAFDFTMRSVLAAQKGLVGAIKDGDLFSRMGVRQDRSLEIRYTKNKDFNDNVASVFLEKNIKVGLDELVYPDLIDPVFG